MDRLSAYLEGWQIGHGHCAAPSGLYQVNHNWLGPSPVEDRCADLAWRFMAPCALPRYKSRTRHDRLRSRRRSLNFPGGKVILNRTPSTRKRTWIGSSRFLLLVEPEDRGFQSHLEGFGPLGMHMVLVEILSAIRGVRDLMKFDL